MPYKVEFLEEAPLPRKWAVIKFGDSGLGTVMGYYQDEGTATRVMRDYQEQEAPHKGGFKVVGPATPEIIKDIFGR